MTDTHEQPHTAEHRPHPPVAEYVKVAIFLAVVTGIEVGLFYAEDAAGAIVVPALLILSGIKFAMVVLWFMHLRFDSPLLGRLFIAGLVLAIILYVVMLATFGRLLI